MPSRRWVLADRNASPGNRASRSTASALPPAAAAATSARELRPATTDRARPTLAALRDSSGSVEARARVSSFENVEDPESCGYGVIDDSAVLSPFLIARSD